MEFSVNVFEENFDLRKYAHPKSFISRNIAIVYPSSTIVTQNYITLRKTFLQTDRGKLVSYYDEEHILEQHELKTSVRQTITDQN